MACPALEVPEVGGHLCHPSNLNSTWVVNPNGLDPPHQEPNKDGCPSIMVYWDNLKYDVCKGAGRRNSKDIDGTLSKILNSNALDPPIKAHILNGLDPLGREPMAMHCTRA